MLGTTQAIRDDGSTVPVGGARLRALLTALALRPGRAVPVASLVDEVWDGDPPADGPAALQALVGRLRRALGREAVGSGEGGYWLVAARDDIDLYRFERLARAAAQASPAEAAALYDEALALWRGEPLSSLPGSGPEAARWEALRLDARRGRLHAALALGEAERVLPELTALCAGLPLDELLQALRIRALRDAGRPAEALAAYDEVRRDLATRLGTTPGPALRALHTVLLTDPTAGPGPLPGTPAVQGHSDPAAGPGPLPPAPTAGTGRTDLPARTGRGGSAPDRGPGHPAEDSTGRTEPAGSGVPAGTGQGPSAAPAGPGGPVPGPGQDGRPGTPAEPHRPSSAPPGTTGPDRAGSGSPAAPDGAGYPAGPAGSGSGSGSPAGPAGSISGRTAGPGGSGSGGPDSGDPYAGGPDSGHAYTGGPGSGDPHTGGPGSRDPHGAAAVPGAGQVPTGPGAGNLRMRLTTFVGREEDIRVIGDDLARSRLVTLLGPGGAGKTRLSQEAAEAHARAGRGTPDAPPALGTLPGGSAPAWADGVWFVELAPVDDPEDVAEAVLAALGARETKLRGGSAEEMRVLTERGGDHPLDRLAEHCGRRRMLLILDNCEHVVDAAARLAEEVLARCPGVQILATSREPLGVPGETLRPVEPLPDPVALRLLGDRGAAARAGFTVDEDPDAAAEICRRLDGMPLAIELAAARLRLLTPRQIADRLDDRFRLLTGGSRTHLPRQQTLRAVVDWSWDLLDEPERAVLRRLSVFAGGCDLDAAEAVCADGGYLDGGDVADLLGSLVDKSLVVAAPDGPAGMRFRLLETVAEYAADRLAEAGEDRAETEHRHLTHYRELARTTEPLLRGHGQRAAADRLATEYENLRTALRRAVAAKDVGEVLCLVHSLGWYWHMHDLRAETRHWAGAAAALGPDPFAAPVVPAEPVYEQIVDTPPPYEGELLTEAWRGIQLLCLVARDQISATWSTPEVRAQAEGVVAAYRPGLPQTCRAPSFLWIYAVMISGDAELLHRATEETVETARALGYRWELASALQLRANVLANRADGAGSASRDAEESLALYASLGDDWGCAEALSARAEAREKRGEYVLAAQDYRAAIEYARRLGAKAQVTVLQVRMAGTLAEDGLLEEAEEILTGLLAGAIHQFGNEAVPAAQMFLACIYGRTGRLSEARAQLQSLREEFAVGAFAMFDGFLLGLLAWIDNEEGRYEDAVARLRQAMEAVRDPLSMMLAPHLPAAYLITGARSLAQLGGQVRAYDAARLIGAYHALLPPAHFPVTLERADAELAERLARAALGDAAYEAAYAEGGGLTLEEATALV
ncbi:BTAD domain-containing putative transcriptional regulator [Streptomyces sp. AP-93]|uniref:AfsR/SARP family transcriptional regulator n=1 Tax=Streptomyces sp. AP-93 TaxID=2929048 RepID=UPI001FAF1BEC|nr:BTAD domain-containing putative transcriptional regulator [Streptomyces sp. AP-93]MCJ0867967.1 winged helix-turn-helix domain-containing protein [Streptomyces sp. AP-93]